MPYVVGPLPRERIDQAYALVRLARPDTGRGAWTALADTLLAAPEGPQGRPAASGIVALQNRQGYLFGLFCYRVRRERRLGRILAVSHFIVMAPVGADTATDRLCTEMDGLCRALDCRSVDLAPVRGAPIRAPAALALPEEA